MKKAGLSERMSFLKDKKEVLAFLSKIDYEENRELGDFFYHTKTQLVEMEKEEIKFVRTHQTVMRLMATEKKLGNVVIKTKFSKKELTKVEKRRKEILQMVFLLVEESLKEASFFNLTEEEKQKAQQLLQKNLKKEIAFNTIKINEFLKSIVEFIKSQEVIATTIKRGISFKRKRLLFQMFAGLNKKFYSMKKIEESLEMDSISVHTLVKDTLEYVFFYGKEQFFMVLQELVE